MPSARQSSRNAVPTTWRIVPALPRAGRPRCNVCRRTWQASRPAARRPYRLSPARPRRRASRDPTPSLSRSPSQRRRVSRRPHPRLRPILEPSPSQRLRRPRLLPRLRPQRRLPDLRAGKSRRAHRSPRSARPAAPTIQRFAPAYRPAAPRRCNAWKRTRPVFHWPARTLSLRSPVAPQRRPAVRRRRKRLPAPPPLPPRLPHRLLLPLLPSSCCGRCGRARCCS